MNSADRKRRPQTLVEAMDDLRAAWRHLCETLLAKFPPPLRPVIPEAMRRTYRILVLIGAAHFVIAICAMVFAMATGQFDWSAR